MGNNEKQSTKLAHYGTENTQLTLAEASLLSAPAHTLSADDVLAELDGDRAKGLSESTAAARLNEHGPNLLEPPPKASAWKLLSRQILNAMTLVLLAAMAVSFGTKSYVEAGVIVLLVILNVTVGFTQEWKAEKVVAALASVGAPVGVVLRAGNEIKVPCEDVVPGDVVCLSPGSIVPADARVIASSELQVDEALLTGESLPITKSTDALKDAQIPLGDRLCMVYAGSRVTKGRGQAVVVCTGMGTELGKISSAISRKVDSGKTGWAERWEKIQVALGTKGTTSLQMKLNKMAYLFLGTACLLAIVVVASTAFKNIDPSIATYAVATAVSILPASLITVVSLTLATASRELAKENALVRRMDAIEGLSVVTDICSDKTGTLTVGKMVLKKAWVPTRLIVAQDGDTDAERGAETQFDSAVGQIYQVETGSDPYFPRGAVRVLAAPGEDAPPPQASTETVDADEDASGPSIVHPASMEPNFAQLVLAAGLCNMATIHEGKEGRWEANGDATEVALQVFAHKMEHGKPHLTRKGNKDQHWELAVEHPFDSSIKRMSTAWVEVKGGEDEAGGLVFMKGGLEGVLDRCATIGIGEDETQLNEDIKRNITQQAEALASEGLRVLALSAKRVPDSRNVLSSLAREKLESQLCFLGLAGIYDPPRPETRGAVLEAAKAGITTRMLTGDHPGTAAAIAKAVGILPQEAGKGSVITGPELDAMSDAQIDAMPELPLVVARCSPETKVKMVEALHRRRVKGMRRTCVMTGDGVNDSPALKRADCGIAMGLNGSDVAKSVSDIVLADDNFATITRAIRKGRATVDNLSKFLLYLLSGNVAEVLVMLVGLGFRNELGVSVYPISPVAALWINTIAAGPPALALGLEPPASDVMDKTPVAYKTIFTLWWFIDLVFYGLLVGGLTIANFAIVVWANGNGDLGADCNQGSYNDTCELLYHGRGTTFATLTIMLMLHSLECKHLEQSLFTVDLKNNKLLLWSAFSLSLTVFPVIYIPAVSDYAFQVLGLKWEWGIVFGMCGVYVAVAEAYKAGKRRVMSKAVKHTKSDEVVA